LSSLDEKINRISSHGMFARTDKKVVCKIC
jgi:hypothetical protein